MAWQQHFVTNMFIRPSEEEANNIAHEPDFTVINACALTVRTQEEQQTHICLC